MLLILVFAAVAGAGLIAYAHRVAHGDAVVRRAATAIPGWPADAPPITVALASDIHVGGGSMPPARLTRLIDQIAAERPHLALFAGDFIDGLGTSMLPLRFGAPPDIWLLRLHRAEQPEPRPGR